MAELLPAVFETGQMVQLANTRWYKIQRVTRYQRADDERYELALLGERGEEHVLLCSPEGETKNPDHCIIDVMDGV